MCTKSLQVSFTRGAAGGWQACTAEPAGLGRGSSSVVLCHLLPKNSGEQNNHWCKLARENTLEAESTRLRCRQTGQNFNQERNL